MRKQLKKMAALLCAAVVLAGVPAQSADAAVTAAQAAAKGVDVSKYQGAIDWNSVAANGYSFAFLRIGTSKTGLDPTFVPNMAGNSRGRCSRGDLCLKCFTEHAGFFSGCL